MSSKCRGRALSALAVTVVFAAGAGAQNMCSLTCPANMTLASLPGQQVSGPVNYTVPTPVGCTATTATQLAGIPTGGQFAVGTSTNVFGALLPGGGNEATCQFTVTVTATPALPVAPTQVPAINAGMLAGLGLLTAAAGIAFLRLRKR